MKRLLLGITPLIFFLLMGCVEPIEIAPDINAPAEVDQLNIEKSDIDVTLTWIDPEDIDFKGVRITLFNADNQNEVSFVDVMPDSLSYVFKSLAAGNYYVNVQTRDKENNLSEGLKLDFVFLSKSPVNVQNIQSSLYWNVLHIDWDSLTVEDFTTVVEGEQIVNTIEKIFITIDDTLIQTLSATSTGIVIPDLSDGYHSIKISTQSTEGYNSSEYAFTAGPIVFGEKFVRVKGGGFDFYIARYEVTTEEYRKFIVNDLGIMEEKAKYRVDRSKVEDDAWYKWWYGNDPAIPDTMHLLGFNTWEFYLTSSEWVSNRYSSDGAFGKVTWEGAMLYCLLNYNGRCPTKEEWLYAAEGGKYSQGYDYAGSNDPDEVGWWGTVGADYYQKTVGLKLPNELGIYDMSGNVGEILYELDDAGTSALGKTIIIGGSMGPINFWSNEGEIFALEKPKLTSPEIIKHTGIYSNDARWRMGIRVLIPHTEIVKLPVDRTRYER